MFTYRSNFSCRLVEPCLMRGQQKKKHFPLEQRKSGPWGGQIQVRFYVETAFTKGRGSPGERHMLGRLCKNMRLTTALTKAFKPIGRQGWGFGKWMRQRPYMLELKGFHVIAHVAHVITHEICLFFTPELSLSHLCLFI